MTNTKTRTQHRDERLVEYLRERAESGRFYFKSKFIADDVGLSPSEIGTRLVQLQREKNGLDIEPWGYTNATTWCVEKSSET